MGRYTGRGSQFRIGGLRLIAAAVLTLAAAGLIALSLRQNEAASAGPEPAPQQEQDPGAPDREPASWQDLSSPLDADGDGTDDWHDMVQGARDYIATEPAYNAYGYYLDGYPDDGTGVCTDVIWQAFRAAGYDLKAMVDADIEAHPDWYPSIDWPEPNIDFRRVANLDDFFARHALSLTCSLAEPEAWQAGDIVVFGLQQHIALCSDHRRLDGIPWIIHHGTEEEGAVEVNAMNRHPICAHYRWQPAADDPVVVLWEAAPENAVPAGAESPAAWGE